MISNRSYKQALDGNFHLGIQKLTGRYFEKVHYCQCE